MGLTLAGSKVVKGMSSFFTDFFSVCVSLHLFIHNNLWSALYASNAECVVFALICALSIADSSSTCLLACLSSFFQLENMSDTDNTSFNGAQICPLYVSNFHAVGELFQFLMYTSSWSDILSQWQENYFMNWKNIPSRRWHISVAWKFVVCACLYVCLCFLYSFFFFLLSVLPFSSHPSISPGLVNE